MMMKIVNQLELQQAASGINTLKKTLSSPISILFNHTIDYLKKNNIRDIRVLRKKPSEKTQSTYEITISQTAFTYLEKRPSKLIKIQTQFASGILLINGKPMTAKLIKGLSQRLETIKQDIKENLTDIRIT